MIYPVVFLFIRNPKSGHSLPISLTLTENSLRKCPVKSPVLPNQSAQIKNAKAIGKYFLERLCNLLSVPAEISLFAVVEQLKILKNQIQ